MSDGLRVSIRHLREAKLCSAGGRQWCARNGFSWDELISPGLLVSELRPLNDAFANRLIVIAEREEEARRVNG